MLKGEGLTKICRQRRLGRAPREHIAVEDVRSPSNGDATLASVNESGAGKSTTGRQVLRLIEPDTGTVDLNGVDITALDERRLGLFTRRKDMVFPDPYEPLETRMGSGRGRPDG